MSDELGDARQRGAMLNMARGIEVQLKRIADALERAHPAAVILPALWSCEVDGCQACHDGPKRPAGWMYSSELDGEVCQEHAERYGDKR